MLIIRAEQITAAPSYPPQNASSSVIRVARLPLSCSGFDSFGADRVSDLLVEDDLFHAAIFWTSPAVGPSTVFIHPSIRQP